MSKHTPGPWKVRNGREVFCGNKRICHVNAASKEPLNIKDELDVAAANARLIAAAPELLILANLYALVFQEEKQARAEYGDAAVDRELQRRAIIAKATGEA